MKTREFGFWTVIRAGKSFLTRGGKNLSGWVCRCQCGTERNVRACDLLGGRSRSCGCVHYDPIQEGTRFGRWTVIRDARCLKNGRTLARSLCRCECGTERLVRHNGLRKGVSTSCGCARLESVTTHGLTNSSEYKIWSGMIQRCRNPKDKDYENYGARGISVCEQWNDFVSFIRDMGNRPSGAHSVDRWPDLNGNYEPGNVRWATMTQQARNKRTNVSVVEDGVSYCLSEYAEKLGITADAIWRRASVLRKRGTKVTYESLQAFRFRSKNEPAPTT